MPDSKRLPPNIPNVTPDFVDMPKTAKPSAQRFRRDECQPNTPDVRPETVSDNAETRAANDSKAISLPAVEAVPRWLGRVYLAAGAVLSAVLVLFAVNQTVSIMALTSTLPLWARYALLAPLAFCLLVLIFVAAALFRSWSRLKRIRQVNLRTLEELRNRAESRKDGLVHFQAARTALESYLRELPGSDKDGWLGALGMKEEELARLYREKEYLLSLEVDSQTWLDRFRSSFQSSVDSFASGRVNSWSLKAAGCIMASPLPLLDAVLVLAISLKMIRDLCVIYNVRTGRAASMVLFTRAIRNAFIAGVAEDAANAAGELASEELTQFVGDTALGTLSASFARVLAPKLGEGTINALFMRRLGRATIRMLQPLRN